MKIHRFKNLIDLNIVLQAAPSLLISMIGLIVTGILFDKSMAQKKFSIYSLLLLSSCILSFKGNIELSMAMHISTKRYSNQKFSEYLEFSFVNANALVFQSGLIGLGAGFCGAMRSVVTLHTPINTGLKIIVSAAITCLVTSVIFFSILLCFIEIARLFDISIDNLILPLLSSINDVLVVKGLMISISAIDIWPPSFLVQIFTVIISALVVSGYCIINSDEIIYFQNPFTLGFTCIISLLSGALLEKYGGIFTSIAAAFPVFSGMCAAISYIYIHKKYHTSTTEPRIWVLETTLLLIGLFVALVYAQFSYLYWINASLVFATCFVFLFVLQEALILMLLNMFVHKSYNQNLEKSSNAISIIGSVSDVLSAVTLITMGILIL